MNYEKHLTEKFASILNENKLPPEIATKFQEVGNTQRGAPEFAMLKVQHYYKGGVLSPVVEHVGDLTHRMTEHADVGMYLPDIIEEKVNRGLRYLTHPYGFEREMQENIRANGVDESKLNELLAKYAEEHRKVPVYNRAHYAGREAAVSVGERDWATAIHWLRYLKELLDTETYNEVVSSYELDENGNLLRFDR